MRYLIVSLDHESFDYQILFQTDSFTQAKFWLDKYENSDLASYCKFYIYRLFV